MITKILITGSAFLSSIAMGQSLFAEDPNEEATTSLPLKFNVTGSIGYNDNFTPSSSANPTSSTYVNTALGANYVNYTPKTSWKIGANLSASRYLNGNSSNNDGVYYNARLSTSLNHRLTARTRYVQSSYINYGIEPDYSFSFTPNRSPSEHLFYSTDHAIGHRWTRRFGTYTGVRVTGVDYHGRGASKADNRRTFAFYNDFRYSTAPHTTLVARLEYQKTEASGSAGDPSSIIGSLGFEHQINRNSYVLAQIGATHRDVTGGRKNYFSPYVYATYNASLNAKAKLKIYAKYATENYGTSQGAVAYDTNQTIRVGSELNYLVSPKLSLRAGVNFIRYNYSDGRNVFTNRSARDTQQKLINPYVGFSYEIDPRTSVNASYHYNKSSSSFSNSSNRDYTRNRFQFGVSRVF